MYYLFSTLGGVLYALGYPSNVLPFPVPLLPIIGIALWFYSSDFYKNKSIISLLSHALSFSFGYFLMGYHWIPYTINEFGAIPYPFNYLIGSLSVLILAPHFLLFVIIFKLTKNKFPFWNSTTFVAIILTILEYYCPQQFPAHIGQSWLVTSPYLGLVPFVGAPLYSFFSFWIALNMVKVFKERRIDYFILPSLIIFIIMNINNKFVSYQHNLRDENSKRIKIRLVQANIGNFLKLSSENGDIFSLSQVLDEYKNLSLNTSSGEKADLIIWPETAYPKLLSINYLYNGAQFTPALFKETIMQTESPLFVGGYDQANNSNPSFFETEYNTAFLFNKAGKLADHYHKMKLIPFGENLPFGPLNIYLSKLLQNVSFFASGKKYTLFKVNSKFHEFKFTSAICYEILFSGFIRDFLNNLKEQPDFIINLTNDSWYGNTIEPFQHQYLARWRALEFQKPIVRATNTGITSILFPDGSLSEQLLPFKKGILNLTLFTTHNATKTFFQIYGFLTTLVIMITLFILETLLQKFMQSNKP